MVQRMIGRPSHRARGRVVVSTATLRLPDRVLPITVRRNPRARRMILRIAADTGAVTVTGPTRTTVEEAVAFAISKAAWICGRQAAMPEPVPFSDGASVPILGNHHRIRHDAGRAASVVVSSDEIVVGGPEDRVADRLRAWLKRRARDEIAARVADKAACLERPAGRITLRDPRSRWGSCAANGNLSFSWRLIMAPPAVLDYVVAHEVAHLAVRNHGPDFWRIVDTLTPHVREARTWLAEHGRGLLRYG